jgi:TPR repeat protein
MLLLWSLTVLAIAPSLAHAQASGGVAVECLRLAATPLDYSDVEASTKGRKIWAETCRQAYAADGNDPRIKVALARALQNRAESVPLLRAAAAQNDIEAMLALFNDYNSFDRTPGRPPLISRAEAEHALRRAAELGDRDAMWRLATILARGGPLKRDSAGARLWGEQVLANPPKNVRVNDIQAVVGHWLAKSDNADERKRGIEMLEALAKTGRGDAQAYLATAIRRDDAVRARTLLESALRSYPGHALAPLADMLIKGEGGPKDERRAVSLLQGRSAADAQHAKAMLGQLMLEGRLMPRDVTQAVKLLGPWSQWDYDTRLQIMRLLAENPEVQTDNARHILQSATEAAELGEPGAMDALIALKLSANRQFSDKAGGCSLAERAAKAGDAVAARHLAECRAQ